MNGPFHSTPQDKHENDQVNFKNWLNDKFSKLAAAFAAFAASAAVAAFAAAVAAATVWMAVPATVWGPTAAVAAVASVGTAAVHAAKTLKKQFHTGANMKEYIERNWRPQNLSNKNWGRCMKSWEPPQVS